MEVIETEERDRFSELPHYVLLHIMNFMDTHEAVQTCVLSKQWKDLWKRLTSLSFNSTYPGSNVSFNKFVTQVLSKRDGSVPLLNIDFMRLGIIDPNLLNRVMKYAALHNVQQLSILAALDVMPNFELCRCLFSCRSLTSLKLCVLGEPSQRKLPKSLHLPALNSLHLEYVIFTANDNDCAEPFSNCNKLDTLVLKRCHWQEDAKVLCISNSKLSNLTIFVYDWHVQGAYKFALFTPNLSSLAILGPFNIELSSTSNLSFLEEVNIDTMFPTYPRKTDLLNFSWLQVITNVKIMTLTSHTVKLILNDLSNPDSMGTQPPCFVRLESLKVKMDQYRDISKEEVDTVVEYLLQNSPQARVDVINC